MARLSTHVLDVAAGRPAAGLVIDLYRWQDQRWLLHTHTVTNLEGRTDAPLLSGEDMTTGLYQLVFGAGDYLRSQGMVLPSPAFLDEIVVRFGIADTTGNYHVPLLLSPYGYSTYRGS